MMPLEQTREAEALPARVLPAALPVLHAGRARIDGRGDRRQGRSNSPTSRSSSAGAWRCSTTTSCTTASPTRPRCSPERPRDGDPPLPAASPERAPARTAPPARVGTEEFHSMRLPVAQEAAVLYCANHAEAAIALLKAEIKDTAGKRQQAGVAHALRPLPGRRPTAQEFDALSMLFTVKFEQSPPPWSESGDVGERPAPRARARERKDFFALKPSADGDLAGEIEKFRAFAETQGTVRLDVGKITAHHRRGGDAARQRAAAAAQAQHADVVQQRRARSRRCCAPPSTRRPRRSSATTGCCCSSC